MMFDDDDVPKATFPLLCLPNHVIKNVINQMFIFRKFGFSLISKRTCQLVSETHKTSYAPAISIGNTIYLDFDRWTRFTFRPTHQEVDQSPVQKIKMTGPVNTWTGFEHYSKPEYTMKDWVRHIFKAFNCSYDTVHLKWQEDSERYSVASVKRIFPKCHHLTVNIMNPQFEEVTGTFLANSIDLSGNGLNDPHLTHGFQKILIQNFSYASLDHRASLNTILMTNSVCFNVFSTDLTEREANRTLKLWARGAMPNLKHFSSAVRRLDTLSVEETVEAIFKGIEHSRSIQQVNCQECKSVRHGGYVIYRVGGIKTTVNIYTEDSDEYVLFDVFVEH